VWAARRTAIYEQAGVNLILHDDGYRPLRDDEPVALGDLVLYFDDRGNFYHVGMVMELRFLRTAAGMEYGVPMPWVLRACQTLTACTD
jgi:hypothetical protein